VINETLDIAMFSIHSSPIGELGTKDTGGMSVYIRELARELGQAGHRVDIFTRLQNHGGKSVRRLYNNVRLIHLSIGNTMSLSKLELYPYLEDLFQAVENFRAGEELRYDLVHSHYWLSGRLGQYAQTRWHVPHVIMFHTLGGVKNTTGIGAKEPDLRVVTEKILSQTCDRVLAATQREREQLMRYHHIAPDKIGVVPCGVNLELFRPLDKSAARRELGFDRNESIVLYVGRFDPLKGIERLIDAMTYLTPCPRLRLVLVGGDGNHTSEAQNLRNRSARLGLQNVVTFAGRIPQDCLPPYYCAADVLALPSYYESFGLVGLESLACGTPVVATPVGAMEHILRPGVTGEIVSNCSPRSLAAVIEPFIRKPPAVSPSPEQIRASVIDYHWSLVARAVLEQYKLVLTRPYPGKLQILPAHASQSA
jgi:D-inositol-3-phosphate glycosyltransferase